MADTQSKAVIASVRDTVSDAYAFVRGSQFTKQAAQVTYEQLANDAIGKIRGTTGVKTTRPCKIDRIKAIQSSLASAVKMLRETPVDSWAWGTDQEVSSTDNANTPEGS